MFDKLLDFVIDSVRKEEKRNQEIVDWQNSQDLSFARPISQFWAIKKAHELIVPCEVKAKHHRQREQYWVKQLEDAEKELREKGIDLSVYDSQQAIYMNYNTGTICSGAVSQNFQPRVDQKLMDNCKQCKNKMLEHRQKAETFEKHAKAFSVNPEFTVKLTIDDCHFYGLGG